MYKNPRTITAKETKYSDSIHGSSCIINEKIADMAETQNGMSMINTAIGKDIVSLSLLIIFARVKKIIIPAIIVALMYTIDSTPNDMAKQFTH